MVSDRIGYRSIHRLQLLVSGLKKLDRASLLLTSTTCLENRVFLKLLLLVVLAVADESWEYGLRDTLFTACKVEDVDTLRTLLQQPIERAGSQEESESCSSVVLSPLTLLNKPIDSSGFTLLHVASAAAQKAAVKLLLDAGADPACRYECSQVNFYVC